MTRTATFKGLLGAKLGMTQIFDENARVVPVTVIQAGPNTVTQVKSPERDGYSAVQLAFGDVKAKRVNKPRAGHFSKAGVEPGVRLVELRLDDVGPYEVGQELSVETFADTLLVDVTAVSKGKGFTGAMKRHNFSGQGASHGNHRMHRSPGAVGSCATPARVFKGKKMSGHHGGTKVTTLNLEVVGVDPDDGVLLVKGAVPGPRGGLVLIRDAVKAG